MKTFPQKTAILAATACASVALHGCGGASDPESASGDNATPLSGAVIDGRVAGAAVYQDLNNNKVYDGGEPYALTDKWGYFTYRPAIDEDGDGSVQDDEPQKQNYCDSDNPKHDKYCLEVQEIQGGTDDGEVIIRTVGGFDRGSGTSFEGSLSRSVSFDDAQSGEVSDPKPSTPLTTLVERGSENGDVSKGELLEALGLGDKDTATDYWTNVDKDLAREAVRLQKVVDITVGGLNKKYQATGDEELPNLAPYAFQALAEEIASNSAIPSSFTGFVKRADELAKAGLDAYGEQYPDDFSYEVTSNYSTSGASGLLDRLNLDTVAESVSTQTADSFDDVGNEESDLKAASRTSQIVTQAAKQITDTKDSKGSEAADEGNLEDINARQMASDIKNKENDGDADTSIDAVNADLMAENIATSGNGTVEDLAPEAKIPEDDIKHAWVYAEQEEGARLLAFFKDEDELDPTDDSLVLCMDPGNDPDLTDQVGNKAVRLTGDWETLNDYTLQLTLRLAGQEVSGRLKSLGYWASGVSDRPKDCGDNNFCRKMRYQVADEDPETFVETYDSKINTSEALDKYKSGETFTTDFTDAIDFGNDDDNMPSSAQLPQSGNECKAFLNDCTDGDCADPTN